MSPVVIILMRTHHARPSHVMDEFVESLRTSGAVVHLIDPDTVDVENMPLVQGDICVLKAKSHAARTLGRRYHNSGVPTMSPYPVTELCRDKMATNRALIAAGLPVPECMHVAVPSDVEPMLADGPVILKPVHGSQGRGIRVIHDSSDLPQSFQTETFAQRYLAPDGLDRKIYGIGDELFCVKRVWPPKTLEDKLGQLVELDERTKELARHCGEAIGTDVYGVDVIEHKGDQWIVDMSSFPGFKGVPNAGGRLASRILAAVGRSFDVPEPLPTVAS